MEKRTKKFIFTVPLQEKLYLSTYKSDNLLYQYGKTRYPIIPVINGAVNEDDEIEIVAVLLNDNEEGNDHPWVLNNFGLFIDELETLRQEKRFKSYKITKIKTANNTSIRTQIKLLKDLMNNISNDERLYACITYGTKPTPIVLFNALNYGETLKENTSVESVIYGWYNFRNTEDNKLCDETALYYANAMVTRLGDLKNSTANEMLKQFLDF